MKTTLTLLFALLASVAARSQNNALHFDGVDDYVEVNAPGSFLSGTIFTIELWYKPTAATGHEQTLISRGSGSQFWEIGNNGHWDNSSSLVFYHPLSYPFEYFGSYSYDFSILNQWHHLAVTSDGSTIRLYHDGRFICQDAVDGPLGSATGPIRLGAATGFRSNYSPAYDGGFFAGAIDEVRIWNVARTGAEILADKDREISTSASGLLAYYPFNQGLACGANDGITSLTDAGPASLNGTLHNFTLLGATSNWQTGFPLAASLPVKLVDFSASRKNGATAITWRTAQEENVRLFEVEKSRDGQRFSKLAGLRPSGSAAGASYSYTDNEGVSGTVYYRLRTLDDDGSTTLSKTVAVKAEQDAQLAIYPNPVQSELHVVLRDAAVRFLQVYDVQGRMVKNLPAPAGASVVTVDLNALSPGQYFMRVGDQTASFQKL